MAEAVRVPAAQLQQACDEALAHFRRHGATAEGKAFYANRNSKCYLLFAAAHKPGGGGYRARVHDRELGLRPDEHEYVGNTVNFDKRLQQHNGEQPRGAKRNVPFLCAPVLVVDGFEGGQGGATAAENRQRARTMSLLFENLWEGMFGRPLHLRNVGDLSARAWLDQTRDGRTPVVSQQGPRALAGAFSRQRRLVRLAQLAMLLTHPVWGAHRSWRVWCYHAQWRDLFVQAWQFVYETNQFSWARPWTDTRAADAVPLPRHAPRVCVVGESEVLELQLTGAVPGWVAPEAVLDDSLDEADERVFQDYEAQLPSPWDEAPQAASAWDAEEAAVDSAWGVMPPVASAWDTEPALASAWGAEPAPASAWEAEPAPAAESAVPKRARAPERVGSMRAGKGRKKPPSQ